MKDIRGIEVDPVGVVDGCAIHCHFYVWKNVEPQRSFKLRCAQKLLHRLVCLLGLAIGLGMMLGGEEVFYGKALAKSTP